MPFEIDFLSVGAGDNSGDAIALRFQEGQAWRVMVIDGGFAETGERICSHIKQWYGTDTIDYVVSTHPDGDHISGLRTVLKQMKVRELWLHVPYLHAEAILPLFKSRRWQVKNLEDELRRAYPHVQELVESAWSQETSVNLAFQGKKIGPFTVLSPSLEMYEGLLPQFRDTPTPDIDLLQTLGHWLAGIGRRTTKAIRKIVREDWATETLREGGITSAENESSVILYGNLGNGGILFPADAGLRALNVAADYAEANLLPLRDGLWLFQVPHHGSRNNIAPSILDRIIGPPVAEGQRHNAECMISAGPEDETHPRQVVVNALVRRGLRPTVSKNTAHFYSGIPKREGWNAIPSLQLSNTVEAYD